MQNDNRETKTKVDFVRLFMTKEQQDEQLKNLMEWLGMTEKEETEKEETEKEETENDDSILGRYLTMQRESPLSYCDKEDIFLVRWITQVFIGMGICQVLFLYTQNDIFHWVMFVQSFIYLLFHFRNSLKIFFKGWIKMLKGERPEW